jgi:DNA-binding transcriptional ArsR family regulator
LSIGSKTIEHDDQVDHHPVMSRAPHHPSREQIRLPVVLDCLSDPIRLAIVCNLAKSDRGSGELRCGDFHAFGGKSNLAYHFARLREAGLVLTRLVGTARYMSLRRADLDARFPGLLDAIIASAASDAAQLRMPECESLAEAT